MMQDLEQKDEISPENDSIYSNINDKISRFSQSINSRHRLKEHSLFDLLSQTNKLAGTVIGITW